MPSFVLPHLVFSPQVTVNIPLTSGHEAAELYFLQDSRTIGLPHRKGWAFLHR